MQDSTDQHGHTKMRRSCFTGEFWLTAAFLICGFGVLIYGIMMKADLLGIAAVLGAISTPTIAQVYGRNRVKEKRGDE